MNMQEMKSTVMEAGKETMQKVNHFAKLERFIAAVLTLTPFILFIVDDSYTQGLRDSISNYVFMERSYWFGSLLTLAGALFIFNGAQHLGVQQFAQISKAESRFGKGYNIIFGLALFGVLFFDHENYTILHYVFAIIFFVGCALAMIVTRETPLNTWGDVLGTLTLLSLGVHFLLEYVIWKNDNPFSLLWAEWAGLLLIAVYFIAESMHRDEREKKVGIH
ncbi:hypothetical protein PP182_04445 [Maribacter sp. PR1]|uniref:DUF998 domain-containing protein n=1 Tax=Maribacter cobaltidurans TaxID=1178778 RepID=A0ABU7IQQ6_9FLAO|nr:MULTISPECIES: hypothetical protein [Maribacter]MDC6387915.1 hypothetical protein [Maribacter sp. PR1]MEE1975304.1 hypothetical protein [Maribacter cobaltidurans]